ncbi:uncharacterized protein K441DRAFT_666190 [Cenococcum geophilum 1.58]|uniref:uncharacterized protein n=1 Tax=Cenococcum geophilum 1.58 TaxID=794803 RepID=UPI00358F1476|nr:hypothetical protein K441DRAFT_666190 [Cenococcum geophilum 1.58]
MAFAKVKPPKAPHKARSREKRSRQEITSDSEEEDRRSSTKITRTENKGEDFSPETRRISDLAAEVFEAIESSKRRIGIICRNRTTRIQPVHGHPRTGGGDQATNESRG